MALTFDSLVNRKGATVLIHREKDSIVCPCRTPEGYRDPQWHRDNPQYPECNDAGFVPSPVEVNTKAFVQPANSARGRSAITQLFGEIQTDDHIGIFPLTSLNGSILEFDNWSPAGEEYVQFNGMRFIVIGWNMVPTPRDGSVIDHWEVALRRMNEQPTPF